MELKIVEVLRLNNSPALTFGMTKKISRACNHRVRSTRQLVGPILSLEARKLCDLVTLDNGRLSAR